MFMKQMTYIYKFMSVFTIATLLALLTACRDEADDVLQPGVLPAGKSLTEQFDAIWHGINQNYVFGRQTRPIGMPFTANTVRASWSWTRTTPSLRPTCRNCMTKYAVR